MSDVNSSRDYSDGYCSGLSDAAAVLDELRSGLPQSSILTSFVSDREILSLAATKLREKALTTRLDDLTLRRAIIDGNNA